MCANYKQSQAYQTELKQYKKYLKIFPKQCLIYNNNNVDDDNDNDDNSNNNK